MIGVWVGLMVVSLAALAVAIISAAVRAVRALRRWLAWRSLARATARQRLELRRSLRR